MQKKYYLVTILSAIILFGCKDTVNNTKQESANITIDSSYLKPLGGDPRGLYSPNSPFVATFNSADSLFSNTGEGTLQIQGSTLVNGNYSLILSAKVSGKVGRTIYASLAFPETTNGIWSVTGSMLTITINSGNSKFIPFTADSKGLFLIAPYFSAVPPFSPNDIDGAIDNPNHTTIWGFKK